MLDVDADLVGYEAGKAGMGLGANPFSFAQGSPQRPLFLAWKRGYLRGQRDAEIDEQESVGHFRDAR